MHDRHVNRAKVLIWKQRVDEVPLLTSWFDCEAWTKNVVGLGTRLPNFVVLHAEGKRIRWKGNQWSILVSRHSQPQKREVGILQLSYHAVFNCGFHLQLSPLNYSFYTHPCADAVSPSLRGPASPPSTSSTSSNSIHDILGMYSVYQGCLYLPNWIMEWNNGMEQWNGTMEWNNGMELQWMYTVTCNRYCTV